MADGKRVLDLYGGHCVNTLGAGDEGLRAAVDAQWRALSFQTNLVDLEARERFLEAFGANLPDASDWSVFLSNSGAEANENALKAAFSATGRVRVVAFGGAFHGRTAAAGALTDKARAFPMAPFETARIRFGDFDAATEAIDERVACVFLEPIQSMAGVVMPPDGWLEHLRERCDATGALLAFDEVQTGNGRLGAPFAAQHFGVVPDLITTAKGAAGGLPVGVTVMREAVAERVDASRFGSTFGGGPVVLAAATEVARRIAAPGFLENVKAAGVALRKAAVVGPVRDVRGAGLLLGLVLDPAVAAGAVRDHLLREGVLVGTAADPSVVRLSPPLTLDPKDAEALRRGLASFDRTSMEVKA